MPKRVTAKDVAEEAGVSRTTVSFVLNDVPGMRISEDTRQRVLQAARRLNYHPDASARTMVTGRTSMLGFAVRQAQDEAVVDGMFMQVLDGFSQASAGLGYDVIVKRVPPAANSGAYTALLSGRQVDGVAVYNPRLDSADAVEIQAQGAALVLIGRVPEGSTPFVDVDNARAAMQAVEHFIDQGHRRIAMITHGGLVYTASNDRLTGYRQALEHAGLPYDPALVRHGRFTPRSGFIAMQSLVALDPRPTAIFIGSDTVAIGALHALRRHGLRVPSDVAVVGCDDLPIAAYLDPPLTTIRISGYGLGWAATELLARIIDGEDEISQTGVILDTEFVVRQSSITCSL